MTLRSLRTIACRVWFGLAALDLGLAALLPEGILRRSELPLTLRAGLFAWELLLLALWVLAALAPVLALLALTRRSNGAPKLQITAGFLRWLAAACLVSIFVWSWASYWSLGHFLGISGLRFLAANGWQVVEHAMEMRPVGFVTLNLLLAAFACLYAWLVLRDARRPLRPAEESTSLTWERATAASLLLMALLALAFAWRVPDSVEGLDQGAVTFARAELSGPAAYFWSSAGSFEEGETLGEAATRGLPLEHRKILPIEIWAARADPAKLRRFNVLLVLVESLRPDELMAFGGRREVMPNLETLARDSVIYPKTWSQSSHSNYSDLCTLTSLYPLRDRTLYLYNADSPWPRTLIYDLLAEKGWRTAIFSSQNENWGRMAEWLQSDSLDTFFHSATFDGPTYLAPGDNNFVEFAKKKKHTGKVDDEYTVSAALDWLRQDASRPFFIYLNLQNSHVPYIRPADFPPRFGPEEVDFSVAFGRFPRDKVDVVRDLYSDSLAYVDFQLGRLLDGLREDGRLDDTIVIVTGDTGQAFYEHDFASHGSYLFEEVVRVPLIIKAPGLESGVDSRVVQHIDLPPTILDLVGLPPHPGHLGSSVLAPAETTADRPVFLVCQTPMVTQYAIVLDGWKLMMDVRAQRVELYDLNQDPGELTDLSQARPEIRERLLNQLLSWVLVQIEYYDSPAQYLSEYPPIFQYPQPSVDGR